MQMISDDTKAAEKWERRINCYQRFLLRAVRASVNERDYSIAHFPCLLTSV